MSGNRFETLTLQQEQNYRCSTNFGGNIPALTCDEPAPLGAGLGPSPVQLLLAAIANCLTDSLTFSLRKFKQNAEPLRCVAAAEVGRNAEGKVRVLSITVELTLGQAAAGIDRLERILSQFEDFCTVTRSVAQGIPVYLTVRDVQGAVLRQPQPAP